MSRSFLVKEVCMREREREREKHFNQQGFSDLVGARYSGAHREDQGTGLPQSSSQSENDDQTIIVRVLGPTF